MPQPDDWFAPLVDAVTPVTVDPPKGVLQDRFVAVLNRESAHAKQQIASLIPDALVYFALPLAVFSGNRTRAESVAGIPGVIQVTYAPRGSIESETLVHGFDVLVTQALAQLVSQPGTSGIYGGGTDNGVVTKPALMTVVNFSIGPRSSVYPHRMDDPVNLATLFASDKQLIVAAAGNDGLKPGETMSAWAEAPWVLAVGGTSDKEGTTLAVKSSRGVPERPDSGPDVVAYGASGLDERKTGTSFAAPRVVRLGLLVSAVLLQLRRPFLASIGESPQGTELVGSGFIDAGFEALRRRFVARPGLPAEGLNEAGSRAGFDLLRSAGHQLPVTGGAGLVRRILIAAARPMPNYGPHEVGAGFLDDDAVIDWLAERTGADIVEWFDSDLVVQPKMYEDLRRLRPFDRDGLRRLRNIVVESGPMWLYDYERRRVGTVP